MNKLNFQITLRKENAEKNITVDTNASIQLAGKQVNRL